jgi:hypothetical protein
MICTPPVGFDALGFRDGQHYIAAEPQTLPQVIDELRRDPERAARIARNGQDLVFTKHSLAARARQIRTCLDAVAAGTYRGADWLNGQFSLRSERKPAATPSGQGGMPASKSVREDIPRAHAGMRPSKAAP